MSELTKMLAYDAGDLGSPSLNLTLIFTFDHDSEERLGAGISHQQPALAAESYLDPFHRRRNRRHAGE